METASEFAQWAVSFYAEMLQLLRHHYVLITCSLTVLYLIIVKILRFRNLWKLQKRYSQFVNDPNSMDYRTAHEIVKVVMLDQFPFMYAFSTQWALIKSYGIASGTKLLVQTRRLTNEKTVGKRSEDTGVILGEILIQGLDSERGLMALSKMNWLHAQYGARISNGDLIHTLALFVLEPQRWIDMYEWRKMTELEKVAMYVYWKEIGNRMGVEGLPETLQDLKQWTIEYEKTAMVYADSNRKCYDATVGLFLRNLPSNLKGFAYQVSSCFLEPYVRRTMAVPDPPAWIETLVSSFFWARALLIRHTHLPKFRTIQPSIIGANNRINRKLWLFEPWYVKETTWSRFRRRLGLSGPHPGPEFKQEGYLPDELGPSEYEKVSRLPVHEQARQLKEYAQKGGGEVLGCPFAMARMK
jgi:hypothetical protein